MYIPEKLRGRMDASDVVEEHGTDYALAWIDEQTDDITWEYVRGYLEYVYRAIDIEDGAR